MEKTEHKDKDCDCPICKEGVSCPKCNSKEFEEKGNKKEDGIEIRILECKKCKNGFMDLKNFGLKPSWF